MKKPTEVCSFETPLDLVSDRKWMLGQASWEVYTPVYNVTEKENKIELNLPEEEFKICGQIALFNENKTRVFSVGKRI